MILPSAVFFFPSPGGGRGEGARGMPVGREECEVLAGAFRKPKGSL